VVIATNGVLTGYGLIATNTADTLTLNSSWVGTVPGVGWTFTIKFKGDPSNFKINTYVMDGSVADTRSIEFHTEGSAARGEATLWGIEGGVHPGIATTDGTDKVVCYVARVTPPAAQTGTQPANAVNGDVAFLAFGGEASGVTGAASWNKYLKGIRGSGVTQLYFSSASGTPSMYLQHNSASNAGGIQLYIPGSTTSYMAIYADGSSNHYIQNVPAGANGHYLVIGPNTTDPGFHFNAMSAHTGHIARFGITGSTLASIRASGGMAFSGEEVQTGIVSPSTLTGNTDDWNPTGLATARIIRVNTDASHNLTGIVAQASGTRISIINIGSFDLVLVHSATSTAANQFVLPGAANLTLTPGSAAEIWYDATSTRWRLAA
jgi:hypothetical protein